MHFSAEYRKHSQYKKKSRTIYINIKHLLASCVCIMYIINKLQFVLFMAQYNIGFGLSVFIDQFTPPHHYAENQIIHRSYMICTE